VRLEESYGSLALTRLLEQGDAALSFYAAAKSNLITKSIGRNTQP
jgi:hypothetical protein